MAGLSFGMRTIVGSCFVGFAAGQYDGHAFLNNGASTSAPQLEYHYQPPAAPVGQLAPVGQVAISAPVGHIAPVYHYQAAAVYPGAGVNHVVLQPGMVDCGGHIEKGCGECPQGRGGGWCNGQCTWVATPSLFNHGLGECLPKMVLPGMTPEYSPLGASFYDWAGTFAATMLIQIVFAFVFYVRAVAPGEGVALPQVGEINITPVRRGLFECFSGDTIYTCLYTTFAFPVVAAKNVHIAGVMPYWVGFFMTALLMCGPFALWGYWPGFVGAMTLVALVRAIVSLQVQKSLGFAPNVVKTCVYSLFCMPCDMGRESLEADAEVGAEWRPMFGMDIAFLLESNVENLYDQSAESGRNCMRTCAAPFKGQEDGH